MNIETMSDQEKNVLLNDILEFLVGLYQWDNFDEDKRDSLVEQIIVWIDGVSK